MDPSAEAAAERRLRLRAEDVIALAAPAPVADVAAELDAFAAAASALEAAGVLPADRSPALVSEVVDALVVRGASAWLSPTVPVLDVTRLYDATAGAQGPLLRRVVPVAAPLDGGTVTSVELWSDRAVARVVDADGAVGASHVVGAAGVDDRRVELRGASGGVVAVDLAGGRAAREDPGVVVAGAAGRTVEALLLQAVAQARADRSEDGLNGARSRLAAAVDALAAGGGDGDGVLGRFDAAVADLVAPSAAPFLLDVVPVARRFFGGWLLSVEVWSDHWRAVVVPEGGSVPGRWGWTAVDGDGRRFGAVALDDEVLRLDPALPLDWSVLVLERHGGGEVLELEVRR